MVKIDALDRQIIDLLMEDGRMQSAEIARRLQGAVTERAVRYRIQRLSNNGTIKVSAIVNPIRLGFRVIADVFVEVEPGYIDTVAQRLADHENVSYVAYSMGERDISVQIVTRNNDEVFSFATEFISKLPGVRKTVTYIVPTKIKDSYQWHIPGSIGEPGNEP